MPIPVSSIVKLTLFLSSFTLMVITPVIGVNFSAFCNKFTITRDIFSNCAITTIASSMWVTIVVDSSEDCSSTIATAS